MNTEKVPKAIDQEYLREDQYRDASNLNARMALHQRFGTNPYGWHRWVFDQLDLPANARILELGCGPGQLWTKNLDRLPPGWQVTLSDFSPGMAQQAQQNLFPTANFTFETLDAQAIPFADASFDAVIANHMLYHVPDKPKAFAEIARVLKPGGRLYAATNGEHDKRELFELGRILLGEEGNAEEGNAEEVYSAVASFTLENAPAQLAPWFALVEERRQEDSLHITEAAPLIAYVRSGMSNIQGDRLEALTRRVEAQIAAQGAIDIAKITGLLIAEKSAVPGFGNRAAEQTYLPRPGSYALLFNEEGQVAVMETPRGGFLPGGGMEGRETPEEAMVREVREECGWELDSLSRIGEAVEYVYTPGNAAGIRKECVFFTAAVTAAEGTATEPDHVLVWLTPKEAETRLAHQSQVWAVRLLS